MPKRGQVCSCLLLSKQSHWQSNKVNSNESKIETKANLAIRSGLTRVKSRLDPFSATDMWLRYDFEAMEAG
jgi:hypothetical protein